LQYSFARSLNIGGKNYKQNKGFIMIMESISLEEFEINCLEIIDMVENNQRSFVVTKTRQTIC